MPAERIDLEAAPADGLASAFERAAGALREGRLVVLPTETVYGLFALATSRDAVATLRRVAGLPEGAPLAWHAPSRERAIEVVRPVGRVHRRLLDRLLPGPVTFRVGADLAGARGRAGLAPGVADDGSSLGVRAPADHVFAQVAARVDGPLIASGAPSREGAAVRAPAVRDLSPDARDAVALILDAGPTRLRSASTVIALREGDEYAVEREGVLQARDVRRALSRVIVFVCSGNTCRSPMAAAIARQILAEQGETETDPVTPTIVRSAGAFAGAGAPATEEAVRAVEALGAPMGPHRSTPLTREIVFGADEIYALTQGHLDAIRSLDPAVGHRAMLLDPDGADVPDPIGHPQDAYNETARAIRAMLERRLGSGAR